MNNSNKETLLGLGISEIKKLTTELNNEIDKLTLQKPSTEIDEIFANCKEIVEKLKTNQAKLEKLFS